MPHIRFTFFTLSVLLCAGTAYWCFLWATSKFNTPLDANLYLTFPALGMTFCLIKATLTKESALIGTFVLGSWLTLPAIWMASVRGFDRIAVQAGTHSYPETSTLFGTLTIVVGAILLQILILRFSPQSR